MQVSARITREHPPECSTLLPLIYEMSQHSTAIHILQHCQHRPIDRFIPGVFRHRPPAASVADHEAMAEAIAAGQPARAAQITFEHLTNPIETLQRY